MADLGRWFKLWCSSTGDPDLSCLTIEDFGRWCKFGTYTKEHGTDGNVVITTPPCPVIHRLQTDFQVETFDDVLCAIKRFPHVQISPVSSETNSIVSFLIEWDNWGKYQGDFSSDRVRRYRAKKSQNETPKKRREEKRREERRGEENKEPPYSLFFESFWKLYPKKSGKKEAYRQWQKEVTDQEAVIAGLKKQIEWRDAQPAGVFIPEWKDPERWIKGHRWKDELSQVQNDDDEQRRIAKRVFGIKDGN